TLPGDGNLWKEYVPPTDRNEVLGFELARDNVGTITRAPAGNIEVATLALEDSGMEVRAGDRLIPVEAQPYDLKFVPHPPRQLPAEVRVLAGADALTSGGPRDVVALSAGAREGIDNGTVISLWRHGTYVNDTVTGAATSRTDDRLSGAGVALPEEY